VDTLDMRAPGFCRAETQFTGRKPYHPGDLLKLSIYGYLISDARDAEGITVTLPNHPSINDLNDYFPKNALTCDAGQDCYICPAGECLVYKTVNANYWLFRLPRPVSFATGSSVKNHDIPGTGFQVIICYRVEGVAADPVSMNTATDPDLIHQYRSQTSAR